MTVFLISSTPSGVVHAYTPPKKNLREEPSANQPRKNRPQKKSFPEASCPQKKQRTTKQQRDKGGNKIHQRMRKGEQTRNEVEPRAKTQMFIEQTGGGRTKKGSKKPQFALP
jgi:hypothetical protein